MFAQAQPDVFSHGQGVKQTEVLKHHADAEGTCFLRITRQGGYAVNHHAARIRFGSAVNDFHQGRFTGAVFTQHRMNFAGLQGQ